MDSQLDMVIADQNARANYRDAVFAEIARLTGCTEDEASFIAGDCDEGFDDDMDTQEYAGEILAACDHKGVPEPCPKKAHISRAFLPAPPVN